MDSLIRTCHVTSIECNKAPEYDPARELALEFDCSQLPVSKKSHHMVTEIKPTKMNEGLEGVGNINPLLFSLQMKQNESRAKLKEATKEEMAPSSAVEPKVSSKQRNKEHEYHSKQKLEEKGIDAERYQRLHQTQEDIEQNLHNDVSKELCGYGGFGPDDSDFVRSFLKRSRSIPFSKSHYNKQRDVLAEDFYAGSNSMMVHSTQPSSECIERLVDELAQQQKRRGKFHRKRAYKEERDITYINEENKHFNRQLDRHYDKYTAEIKESLERGTAL